MKYLLSIRSFFFRYLFIYFLSSSSCIPDVVLPHKSISTKVDVVPAFWRRYLPADPMACFLICPRRVSTRQAFFFLFVGGRLLRRPGGTVKPSSLYLRANIGTAFVIWLQRLLRHLFACFISCILQYHLPAGRISYTPHSFKLPFLCGHFSIIGILHRGVCFPPHQRRQPFRPNGVD